MSSGYFANKRTGHNVKLSKRGCCSSTVLEMFKSEPEGNIHAEPLDKGKSLPS